MKKSVKIAIISAIAAVIVISALAVTVHLRLSAIEGNETREESTSEKINEAVNVITNQTSEENESAEQLEKEGK